MLSGLGLQLLQSVVRRNGTAKNVILLLELRKKYINIEEKEQQYTPQKGKLKSTLLQFICSER